MREVKKFKKYVYRDTLPYKVRVLDILEDNNRNKVVKYWYNGIFPIIEYEPIEDFLKHILT